MKTLNKLLGIGALAILTLGDGNDCKKESKQINYANFLVKTEKSVEMMDNGELSYFIPWKSENEKIYSKFSKEINQIFKNSFDSSAEVSYGANYCFRNLPINALATKSSELVKLSEICKKNTGTAYHFIQGANSYLKIDVDSAVNMALEITKEMNFTHFGGYCEGKAIFEILNNVKNSGNNRPIALILKTKYDHEDAVHRAYGQIDEMYTLTNKYNLLVYEIDSEKALFNKIKEVGQTKGLIDLFIISAHGLIDKMGLGDPFNIDENKIDFSDTTEIKDCDKYFSKNAKIILNSCLTGKNGKEGNNLANFFAKNLPGKTIYAPMDEIESILFKRDKRGFVEKVFLFEGNFYVGNIGDTYKVKYNLGNKKYLTEIINPPRED